MTQHRADAPYDYTTTPDFAPAPKPKRHLVRKTVVVGGAFILGVMVGSVGGGDTTTAATPTPTETVTVTRTVQAKAPAAHAVKAKAAPIRKAAPDMTPEQSQAVGSAQNYLTYQAFSRKGLIHQLKFEGFSTADATYGADHAGADWMAQAVKSAKNYLSFQHFSRAGLIHQLEFEGFTSEQAAHGADGAL